MAAVRRFLAFRNKFTSLTNGLNLYFNSRQSLRERTVLRHVGTGLCITLGGFAVVYYQHRGHAASLRALISPLPAVAAKEQVYLHFSTFYGVYVCGVYMVYYYIIPVFITPKLLKIVGFHVPSKQSLSTREVLNSLSRFISPVMMHCDTMKLLITEILEQIL